MALDVLLYAGIAVFLAELGDKTMLATICLSAQCRQPRLVLLAAMLALTTATIIAIIIGMVLAFTLPLRLIFYLSGFVFLLMGIYTLATSNQIEEVNEPSPQSIVGMFSVVLLAELGDKTQLAVLSLTAQSDAPLFIFFGALLGFLLVNGLGAAFGDKLAAYASIMQIKRISGLFFITFGLLSLFGIIQ